MPTALLHLDSWGVPALPTLVEERAFVGKAAKKKAGQWSNDDLAHYVEVVESALESLSQEAITKPLDLETLLRTVRVTARRQRALQRRSERNADKARGLYRLSIRRHEPASLVQEIKQNCDYAGERVALLTKATRVYDRCILKLEELRTQKLAIYGVEWETYLRSFVAASEDRIVADGVASFWERFSGSLWPPEAGPGEENNSFLMVWDRDEHHLQVEICSGTYDWIYRNKDQDGYQGEEGVPLGSYSGRFDAVLRTLCKAKSRNG